MKKITSILSIMAFTAVFSTSALAQQSSTATSTASTTIVAPIAITKVIDMSFGSFATGSAGTLVLSPVGGRTITGGVKLTATTGNVAAAKFKVTGEGNYAYTVDIPSAHTLTTASTATGAVNTMVVDTFTYSLGDTRIGTLASGLSEFTIGATLNVKANQLVGTYSNAEGFNVTVNYN
jgi:hypothetical protein